MNGSWQIVFRTVLVGQVMVLFVPAGTHGLQPPTAEQRMKYVREGTFARRVAEARRLGNHKTDPGLVWNMRRNLERARLRALGKSDAEIDAALRISAPPLGWQGGLPATGTPRTFVLLVEFPNFAHAGSQMVADVESKFFGDGNTADRPYESLRNYYQRSSYNQLTISGTVFEWYTAKNNREYYENLITGDGSEVLAMEALDHFDAQGHDFTQYDNDGDGKIDAFFIKWTGPHGDWSTFWWAYQTEWWGNPNYRLDGKRLGKFVWSWISWDTGAAYSPHVDIHEAGHLLGLPDYYDYDDTKGPDGGVGGLDMMDANWGDHNCFSKFVLGWLTPTTILSGTRTLSLNPSGTSKDCVVVMPNLTAGDPFNEFFMAQYRLRNNGNDVSGYPTDGLVIWHVDARLKGGGYDYQYDNSFTDHKLLRLMEADGLEEIEQGKIVNAGDFYVSPKEFGPNTTPSSRNYSGEDTGVHVYDLGPAGAVMDTTFRVDVSGDQSPEIASIADHSTPAGSPYTRTPVLIRGAAPITWSLAQGPSGMTVNAATGVVGWLDPQGVGSTHTVVIRASNAFGSDDEDWVLTVGDAAFADCNNNGTPDDQEIADGRVRDCNVNAVPDECDIDDGVSRDTDSDGIPDECESDCNGNGVPDFLDLSAGTSKDCNGNTVPDECDVASGTSKDCNANTIPDECDVKSGFSDDCNANKVPDECEPDCNRNGVADACDLRDGRSEDCDGNRIPDECEVDCNGNGVADACDFDHGTSKDCNRNGIPDECDIVGGVSADCNDNQIPDECEPDCNGNGIPDECDRAAGTGADCNGNGLLDECDVTRHTSNDCNGNDIPDECEILSGKSQDCNVNQIPDECEPDCNANGIPDTCDLADKTSADCNGNGIPDDCDLARGVSRDDDANGVPDECEAKLLVNATEGGKVVRSPEKAKYVPGEMVELTAVPADGWRFLQWSGDMAAYAATISVYVRSGMKLTAQFENPPPVPLPGASYRAIAGQPVQFDGSGCEDPLGEALAFQWDFGDGSVGEGSSPVHTYDEPGHYSVSLTAIDPAGNTASTRISAIISATVPEPPEPDDTGDTTDDGGSDVPPVAPASCMVIDNLTAMLLFGGLTFLRFRRGSGA